MSMWAWWLIAAGAMVVVELLTLTVVAGLVAVAAGVAGVVAAVGGGLPAQTVAFVLAGVLLLAVAAPILRARRRRTVPALPAGAAAVTGRRAVVVEPVDRHGGQVKIGGELWSARAYLVGNTLPPGAVVDVVALDGVTALVYPEELP